MTGSVGSKSTEGSVCDWQWRQAVTVGQQNEVAKKAATGDKLLLEGWQSRQPTKGVAERVGIQLMVNDLKESQ